MIDNSQRDSNSFHWGSFVFFGDLRSLYRGPSYLRIRQSAIDQPREVIQKLLYQHLICFTIIGDFTWRVSDCEELVGVSKGDDVTAFVVSFIF